MTIRYFLRSLYLTAGIFVIASFVPGLVPDVRTEVLHATPVEVQTTADLTSLYSQVFPTSSLSSESDPAVLGTISEEGSIIGSGFGYSQLILGTITLIGPELDQEPVDPAGTIMIPKINVNSPIEFDVPVNDRDAYLAALEKGVAQARGTGLPSEENSNTYLFAHSTAIEVNIARYAAVFTKLKDLDVGNRIITFYQGKRYDYEMIVEEIVPSFDTSVLTREHDFPALTLQTCDPPGVPRDRLITTAKLIGVYDR